MKNTILFVSLLFACIFSTPIVFSQGIYFSGNLGYAGAMAARNMSEFIMYNYSYDIDSDISTYEQVKISLGKGINLGGTLGFQFSSNLGVEVGLSYLYGVKYTAQGNLYSNTVDYTTDYTISSKMFRVNTSVVVSAGREKLNPYAKAGMIVSRGKVIFELDDFADFTSGNDYESHLVQQFDGGFAFGFTAGFGVEFKVAEKIAFFGELNLISSSYSPKKAEITLLEDDGEDLLPDMEVSELEVEFVDSYETDGDWPDNEPSKQLKQYFPLSSFGPNLGLKISF